MLNRTTDMWRGENTVMEQSIYDRRRVGTKWEYQLFLRDGTLSEWIDEDEALLNFSRRELDVFHALFELYIDEAVQAPHERRFPRGAKVRVLSEQEAFQVVPRDTPVHRYIRGDDGRTRLLQGRVVGYTHPRYKVEYTGQEWEELLWEEVQAARSRSAKQRKAYGAADMTREKLAKGASKRSKRREKAEGT